MSKSMTHEGWVTRYNFRKRDRYKTLLRETPSLWIDRDGHRYQKSDGWCGGNRKLDLNTIEIWVKG